MTLNQSYQKLDTYKKSKLSPGSFLTAILENDLIGAVLKADNDSKKIIPEITKYCWDNFPHNIWGSPEAVETHLSDPTKSELNKLKEFQDVHNTPIDINLANNLANNLALQ